MTPEERQVKIDRILEIERLPATDERQEEWRRLNVEVWGSVEEPVQPLGERIAARRRDLGWTQAALGQRIARSESWVSQVERGVRQLDRLSVRVALAKVLGMPYDVLFPSAELAEAGIAKVEVVVEMLLDDHLRNAALEALTQDPVVRRVIEELLDRLS